MEVDPTRPSGLVVSGLVEVATGAVLGWALTAAMYSPQLLESLGVRAPHRIRQLHLDLVIMGGLVTAAGAALPGLPRAVAVPLAVSCWTNALAFAPLAVRPAVETTRPYRWAVGASFVTTSSSWVAVAVIAGRRWLASGPRPVPGVADAGGRKLRPRSGHVVP